MKRTNKLLAVVFTDAAIYISEVETAGGSYSLKRSACLDISSMRDSGDMSQLPQQFARLLKAGGFTAKKLIAAINSRSIMTINIKIAAMTDRELIEQAVKLEMERKLEFDIDDVRFDFTNTLTDSGSEVFAVLTLKKHIDVVYAIAKAARLGVECVTVACAATDGGSDGRFECGIVSLDECSQISVSVDGVMRFFKHIANTGSNEQSAANICRAINHYLLSSQLSAEDIACSILADSDMSQAIAKELKKMNAKSIGVQSSYGFDSQDESFGCVAAGHLASSVLAGKKNFIDLKNRKQASKKKTHRSSFGVKISAAVLIVLIGCGIFFYNWRSDYVQLNQVNEQLQSMDAKVKEASAMIDKINYTKKWFISEPVYLDVLRKLTETFPEEGTIWLTSFGSDESMNSIITGGALEEKVVLDVLDSIKKDPSFKDTRIVYIRKSGKSSTTVTFAFNFKYSQEH